MAFVYQSAIHSTPRLKSLLITNQPTKTNYIGGEVFDPTGLEITAIYTNGSTKVITDYTYSPTRPLIDTDTEIVISYTEKNITKTINIPISVATTLSSITVSKPPTKTTYLYNETFQSAGMEVTATFSNGTSKIVSGWNVDTTTLTTLGTNTITVTYSAGGVVKTATTSVTVNPITLLVPSQSNTLTYNGNTQNPTWNNYDSNQLTIGGTTSGTNATGYTATFTPKYGYVWSDGTTSAKNVNWQINRAIINTIPTQSNYLTYTGSSLSPTWNNYNSSQLTIGGTTSGTNAGSYNATFTPTSNYQWGQGVTSAKTVTWTISKATRTLTITAVSGVTVTNNNRLNISQSTAVIDITYSGPQDAGVVTYSLPNGTSIISKAQSTSTSTNATRMTITAVANGTTNLNLIVAAGLTDNYEQTSYLVSCTVNMPIIKEITDSWATIKQRSQNGQAANYYSVGSWKNVQLQNAWAHDATTNEQIQSSVINQTFKAFIVGINHNKQNIVPVDTSYKGDIICWQLGKIGNVQAAIYDKDVYNTSAIVDGSPFILSTSSDVKTTFAETIMYSFLEIGVTVSDNRNENNRYCYFPWLLPNDLKSVLQNMQIPFYYPESDTIGVFYAKITLPSACEINPFDNNIEFYMDSKAIAIEKQLDYYANGNNGSFYKYDDLTAPCHYWTRTFVSKQNYGYSYTNAFMFFSNIVRPGPNEQWLSYGICPIFFT